MSTNINNVVYNLISGSAVVTGYTVGLMTNVTILDNVIINGNNYSVTRIGTPAFLLSQLTSITIPNSVTTIGAHAFSNCTGLTSITIPNSVTSIGEAAFFNCINLPSITIPNSVTSIGDYAFGNCTSLTSVNIGNSVTSIGLSAFAQCISLTSITIPNSVTTIGDRAFGNCTSLSTVIIQNPANVTTIYANSFTDVSSNLSSNITFNSIASFNELSPTWKTIAKYYAIITPPPPPIIMNFSIPNKIFGNIPFAIIDPSSNSTGLFRYTSSNTDVATISGNVITIIGLGTSIITATQEATTNYTEGIKTTTFQVFQSSSINPVFISNANELSYFMNTLSKNSRLIKNIKMNSNLKQNNRKNLFAKGIKQIRLLKG